MKKDKVITLIDGLTGEIIDSCDVEIMGEKSIHAFIEKQVNDLCFNNDHDLQIRTSFRL